MVSVPLVFISLAIGVLAAPVVELNPRSTTALTTAQVEAWAPYTQFARATYCDISTVATWSCGDSCTANSDFVVTLTGGDGGAVPHYFVGWWPSGSSIVVAHEGTDPTSLESDLVDIDVVKVSLSTTLFPGVSTSVQAHEGFVTAHAAAASTILAEVNSLMTEYSTSSITVVGHSLGGALSELDGLFFALNIPSASITVRTYGTPRVGNSDFADLIDSKTPDFTRINNEHDLIPILPPQSWGYEHPEGEIHIVNSSEVLACPGIENTEEGCTIATVPTILDGDILNHLGPYEGLWIGTIFC
ncbi:alpha/beta-hydrolase [Fistulina hepatica ATCC 64428]|uniref:Alpha/beta-hydrolase n=1 Tax=Fistulina hepatica ATCC 64428 TaxID=1128425 RepID=A0A0D7AP97_9AGAR|nr:alpha/beta-hydrolase [Fistulina hepatica ATCC 64428]